MNLFVLAKPTYTNSTDNLLHVWEIDPSGSMNNMDGFVARGYENQAYQLLSVAADANYVYVSGIKGGKNLFIWKYDRKNISNPFEETVFDIDMDSLEFIQTKPDQIMVNFKNRLFAFNKNGKIVKNIDLKTEKGIKKLIIKEDDKELFAISGNYLSLYKLPEYKESNELTFKIFNSETTCNNIDVLVRSDKPVKDIIFVNTDNSSTIDPYVSIQTTLGTVYKLFNSNAKNIYMKVNNLGNTVIESIVVNANQLYSK